MNGSTNGRGEIRACVRSHGCNSHKRLRKGPSDGSIPNGRRPDGTSWMSDLVRRTSTLYDGPPLCTMDFPVRRFVERRTGKSVVRNRNVVVAVIKIFGNCRDGSPFYELLAIYCSSRRHPPPHPACAHPRSLPPSGFRHVPKSANDCCNASPARCIAIHQSSFKSPCSGSCTANL